jgi:beta-N-acetylhexosaminidase
VNGEAMSVEDRRLAAGCVLGSFVGTRAPGWLPDAVRDGLGGVLLFAQNVVDDAQVTELCRELRHARSDIVIAIDEEGGDVTRLDAASGSDTPSPAAFGFVDEPELTRDAYADLGRRIRSLGIDLTLAPCADINSNPRNPIIGVRSFGSTAAVVSRHVVAAVEGFHRGGVAVSAKHFPGHGDTTADTHLGSARLTATAEELTGRELLPFAAAIDAGVDAILTAHVVADAVDTVPASLSASWNEHLRGTMGFEGVIITDALDMEAVAERRGHVGVADAAVRALASGADLLCLGSNFDGPMTATVIDHIVDALEHDRLSRESLESSRQRIAALHRHGPIPPLEPSGAARQVAQRAILIDGEVPAGPFVVLECRPPGSMACFNVAWGIADDLRERGWPVALLTPSDRISSICATELGAAGDMPVVVVVRDACVHPWQIDVIDAAVRARPRSVVVVELGWPSLQRSPDFTTVVSHGAARSSARAVLDLLDAKGK